VPSISARRTGLHSLLRHVRPFFAAGGKILVCMPIDAVGTETLDDLRALAAVIQDEAAAQATSGSLRFLFTRASLSLSRSFFRRSPSFASRTS